MDDKEMVRMTLKSKTLSYSGKLPFNNAVKILIMAAEMEGLEPSKMIPRDKHGRFVKTMFPTPTSQEDSDDK